MIDEVLELNLITYLMIDEVPELDLITYSMIDEVPELKEEHQMLHSKSSHRIVDVGPRTCYHRYISSSSKKYF